MAQRTNTSFKQSSALPDVEVLMEKEEKKMDKQNMYKEKISEERSK